jgi:uncharacterized protein
MKDVLEFIARNLVDAPDEVRVTQQDQDGVVLLRLEVAPEDVGKVIGKGGRIARAIRAVMRAAGAKAGTNVSVEIVG